MTRLNLRRQWRNAVLFVAITVLGGGLAALAAPGLDSSDPIQRRAAVLELIRQKPADGIQLLTTALHDENAVVRRSAARGLRELGAPAKDAMVAALSDPDAMVRLTAFQALGEQNALTMDQITAAAGDKECVSLRQSAVQIVARMPASAETKKILEPATKDESEAVRAIASQALYPFPFFRKVESIRDGADQVVNVSTSIPLPEVGWKLKFDPRQNGHADGERWFDPGLNDADWINVSIGQYWDDFGFKGQKGVGWYRGRFTLPAKPALNAVELYFGAVDESAWVWINGNYAGQHDIGPDGWQIPFRLDVTQFVKWGAENQITVRVLNTAFGGGIWKPVSIEVIRLGN